MKASALLYNFVFLIICHTAFTSCPELYQGIKDHSACVPRSADYLSGGISEKDKEVILAEHNKYRAAVDPPACMMLKMYWDDDLAYVAQKWADNCKFEHDTMLPRSIPGSFTAGQNLGLGYSTWEGCIGAWQKEVKDFNYNGTNDLHKIGHYTQVVWATSVLVGCGFAKCKGFSLYACNYGPSGNQGSQLSRPYEKCSKNTPLKDCKGKVCKNGGSFQKDSCDCDCQKYKHIYGPECNINCTIKDVAPCGSPFTADTCYKYSNVAPRCPWLCKTCPNLDTKAKLTTTQAETSIPTDRPTFTPDFSGAAILKYSVISALMVLIILIMI